jgi:uncharacterized protein (TIGR02679 family)
VTESNGVPGFLLEWAHLSGPDQVLHEARSRLEQRRLGPRSSLNVALTPEQRRSVGMMLDAAWAKTTAPVPVRSLRSGLLQNGCTLEDLLVAVGGPLGDRPAEQQARDRLSARQRADALAQLRESLGLDLSEPTRAMVESALDRWVLRRHPPLERASAVSRVVTALPDAGDGVLLSVLAARVARDAHALDRSRPLGRAVARFLAIRTSFSDALSADRPTTGWVDPAGSAEAWRAAWAGGRVACDSVSSQVLVLNLPLTGTAAAVRLCSVAGSEPVWLSLRALSGDVSLERPTEVFVCENPSILESAADRLGERCAPLICTFGRPGLAAIQLLRAVAGSATMRIRADGDAAGWGIVATLTAAFPTATLWRMPSETTAFEEELLDLLLADLSAGSSRA